MITFLLLGSLALGLISIGLVISNLLTRDKGRDEKWISRTKLSGLACGVAVAFQVIYHFIETPGNLLDTSATSVNLSIYLTVAVVALNIINYIFYYRDGNVLLEKN